MGRGMEGSRRRAAESTNHHLLPWTGVSVPHFHFAAEEAPCSKDVPAAVGLASGKAAWSLLWALLTAARLLVLSGVREPVNDGAGVPCSMHMQTTLPFPSPLPSRGCTSGRRDIAASKPPNVAPSRFLSGRTRLMACLRGFARLSGFHQASFRVCQCNGGCLPPTISPPRSRRTARSGESYGRDFSMRQRAWTSP